MSIWDHQGGGHDYLVGQQGQIYALDICRWTGRKKFLLSKWCLENLIGFDMIWIDDLELEQPFSAVKVN